MASGAFPGALIGWIFGLPKWLDPVFSGLPPRPVYRVYKDFPSVSFMQPVRYDGAVAAAVADEAVRLPAELPSGTGTGTGSGAWKSSRPRSGPAVT